MVLPRTPLIAAFAAAALALGASTASFAQATLPQPPSSPQIPTAPSTPTAPTPPPPSAAPPAATTQQTAQGGNPSEPSSPHRFDLAGPSPDACSAGPPALTTWTTGSVADSVKAMTKATKTYLENCHCPDAACVAAALDNYAAALEAIGPQLPPQVADLPAIVRRAALKVRAARTLVQAHAAIREAVHVIQAKLTLLIVDDPDTRSDKFRSASFAKDALVVADLALRRVSGL